MLTTTTFNVPSPADLAVVEPPRVETPALPAGFPDKLVSELAWIGSDFVNESDYVFLLSDADLAEIKAALAHFKSLGLDGDLVSPESFPLPGLSSRLDKVSRDVHDGKGFAVIRGLDPRNFSVSDITLLYLGLQSYVANERGRQDKRGNMLVHIIANKRASEHHRHSTKSITFHNEEAGDVISWLTRSSAASGGKCIIASAYTIYNALAAGRPDIIRTLAKGDWPFAWPRFHCRPIMYYEASRLIMNFGRAPLLGSAAHPRPSNVPTVTASQAEALDAVDAIAKATEFHFQTVPGDIHFINNLAILHRRAAFVDGETSTEKRHLVRMRLRSSGRGWTVPEALKHDWDDAFGHGTGKETWHLEPMPDFYLPLRNNPN